MHRRAGTRTRGTPGRDGATAGTDDVPFATTAMPRPSNTSPELSVVVAARNAAETLGECLGALCAQAGPAVEVVVVDDASTDDTAGVAERFDVRLVRLDGRRGPAGARNRGVRGAGAPLVLFVDADTVPAPDLLDRARAVMADPEADAVSGSYDDEPRARAAVSLFKNLSHHHLHVRGAGPVRTFFAGCGVVRRARFLEVGGFDEARFTRPSVEDIDLGYRLVDAGGRLSLDPSLRVKHLKRWTLPSLVFTDLTRRAVPWTVLALERGGLPVELNAAGDQRVAALAALTMVGTGLAAPVWPPAIFGLVAAAAGGALVNRSLFALFWRKGGARLCAAGFLLQQLYYVYALAGAAAGAVLFVARRLSGRARREAPSRGGAEPEAEGIGLSR